MIDRSHRGSILGHPLRYLLRQAWWIAAGALCLVATNVVAQFIPWVVKWTIESISSASTPWEIGRHGLLIIGLAVGQALTRIPSRIFIFNAARQAEYELRGTLFSHLLGSSAAFFRMFRTGDLMSRLTNDLSSVRAFFGPGVLHVVNTSFAYCIALPMMIRIDPWLTLWALLPYPLLLLAARYFARGIYSRSRELQQSLAAMNTSVQEDLTGIRELKLHSIQRLRSDHFARSSGDYLLSAMRLASWRAGLIPVVGLGSGASLVIVLWLGGGKVIDGHLTLGDLVALNLYVGLLAWPTMALGWILSLWQRGVASWHRLQEIIEATAAALEDAGDPDVEVNLPSLDIEVRDLTLHLDDQPVLHEVSFAVPQKTLCAVVGRVGCGKSTLIDAIARQVAVDANCIFIGGRDVTDLPLHWIRRQMAYAPQSAFLFSTSIRNNIAYGLPETSAMSAEETAQRIHDAVVLSGLAPDLDSFPQGLDTIVGERGLSLSGGQRQRIALARALMADRPILLLDDSLSSVDADTERHILQGLSDVMQNRTVILVSHRLSALRHADQVVVLERGRVAEVGTHRELLNKSSLYAELYRRQLLAEELS